MTKGYVISKEQSDIFTWMKYVCAIMIVYIHSLAEPVLDRPVETGRAVMAVRHILDNGTGGVLAAATPCFFLLSGFFVFNSSRSYKDMLKRRTRSLAIPYFLVNGFWVVFFGIFSNIPLTAAYFTNYRISGILDILHAFFDPDPLYYPFWYIQTLFFLILFSGIYRIAMDRFPFLFAAALIIYVFFVPLSVPYILPKNGILWFCSGYYISRYRLADKAKGLPALPCIGVWVLAVLINAGGFFNFTVLSAVCGITALYKSGEFFAPGLKSETLKRFSRYVLPIYSCHEFWEAMAKKILYMLLPQNQAVLLAELLFLPLIMVIAIQFAVDMFYKYIWGRIRQDKNSKNDG